jgi:hypothetical protein
MWIYGNNSIGTLAQSLGVGVTQLVLNPGQYPLFPTTTSDQQFYVTLTDVATKSFHEIVLVTATDLAVFNITRAQDGTSERSWLAGDIVSLNAIRLQYDDFLSKTFGGTIASDVVINALLTALSASITNNLTVGGTTTALGFNVVIPPPSTP